ncbi:MAG: hypothetical protein GKR89_00880 [Candidatus Latescibacteria bacterium]|nr:hypothetical protein [Candidatus Latescibacterota bacterium]
MVGDGVFMDGRTHWEGRIGQAGMRLAKYEGGAIELGVSGGDRGAALQWTALSGIEAELALVCQCQEGSADYGQVVAVRQVFDRAPKFHFLEEGSVRLGMRVAFDLLDEEGHYHGDGRLDIWAYPEGDFHLTYSVQTVDGLAHGAVQSARLRLGGDKSLARVTLGGEEVIGKGRVEVPFGDALADKAIWLEGDQRAAALCWARNEGHVFPLASDHGDRPPFYASRWPSGMQQWARGGMGWICQGDSARVCVEGTEGGHAIDMAWLQEAAVEDEVTCTATLVISLGDSVEQLKNRVAAVQQPLEPSVRGGSFRCYTDEDGTYEIGQGDPTQVAVEFPADPLERVVRLRYYRRKIDPRHCGGVVAQSNGKKLRPQLMSEGELTDDICVVMEMSHRNDSVDDVLVSTQLRADGPTEVVIEKTPGIQATYQSEITGVDLQRRGGNRRDVAIWSSHQPERPLYEFDLFSGAVHRLTHYGQSEPVLWEMPMAWFKSCGISKHDYCNNIEAFEVLDPGPEAVELYMRGTNPNRRAQSELWLRTPFDHPRPRLEVRMRLEVLQQWDHDNAEFSDIFPYPSRLPETWFHDAVLFVQRDGSYFKPSFEPDTSAGSLLGESNDPHLFYGLYASDKGNILTLIKNPQHPERLLHYSVCGNYVDVHVNFNPGKPPIAAGTVIEVEYTTEVYGDGRVSDAEIKQIGLKSLEAGDIVVD